MTLPAHALVRVVVVYGTHSAGAGGHDIAVGGDWPEALAHADRLVEAAADRGRPVQKITLQTNSR